jgi:hypothetical protein
MHGYKKPKNEWAKKKSKSSKFNDFKDEFGYEKPKDNKKNKRYYRVKDGIIDDNNFEEENYK